MMPEPRIRAMTAPDWPRVAEIYAEGIDTGIATFETRCPSWTQWDGAHLPTPRLVAVLDETIVGWVALSRVSAREVYAGVAEVSIYVAAKAQGKGVGRALLTALDHEAYDAGIWTLQSSIIGLNETSLRLHDRCGYRTVGVRQKLGKDRNNVWQDIVLMEKRNQL